MPLELPKTLPPRRRINYEIELISRTKPSVKNAYRMVPPELAKLRKQLHELLATRFIRPMKAPYGAHVLFQKDPFAQAVVALAKAGKTRQFWVEEDLLLTNRNILYDPRVGDMRKKLLYECHDTL